MTEPPDIYEECIAGIVRRDPILAFARVPTGVTAFWGASFGWPDWMVEGTVFAPGRPLPKRVRLIEDLQLMANLLRHEGEQQLIEMMAHLPRYTGDRTILTAPDLEAALRYAADHVTRTNLVIDMEFSAPDEVGVVEFDLSPLLGPFRSFYEKFVFVWLFQVAQSFAVVPARGTVGLSETRIEEVHGGVSLASLLSSAGTFGSGRSRFVIPAALLRRTSPDYDQSAWQALESTLEARRARESRGKPLDMAAIEEAILFSLREHARAPQLAEIARMHAMSQRTFARTLAHAGLSFRALLDDTRMALAQELLVKDGLSVKAVSERLGYSDVTAFTRSFRRRFGTPPGLWRRSGEKVSQASREYST